MMLTMDPPDHERLRRIVGREFAPKDIHRFRPVVERFVRQPDGIWGNLSVEGLDREFPFATVPVRVRLADVYAGVTFPAAGRMLLPSPVTLLRRIMLPSCASE